MCSGDVYWAILCYYPFLVFLHFLLFCYPYCLLVSILAPMFLLETEVELFAVSNRTWTGCSSSEISCHKLWPFWCMCIKFENGIPNEAIVPEWVVSSALWHFIKVMYLCTARCKMLLLCAKTVVIDSCNFELALMKKEEEIIDCGHLVAFMFLYFCNALLHH